MKTFYSIVAMVAIQGISCDSCNSFGESAIASTLENVVKENLLFQRKLPLPIDKLNLIERDLNYAIFRRETFELVNNLLVRNGKNPEDNYSSNKGRQHYSNVVRGNYFGRQVRNHPNYMSRQ